MKAEELMIGDLVRLTISHKPVIINGITYDSKIAKKHLIHFFVNDGDARWNYSPESFEPIPITPEILEKNGFERRDDLTKDNFLPFIIDRLETEQFYEIVVDWRDDFNNGADDPFNVESWPECWQLHCSCGLRGFSCDSASIIYVHELQHALRLCGIEKEIVL